METNTKKTILLVDDNSEIRSMFKDVLEDRGYNVIECEDVFRGVFHIARRDEIHAVITDYNMPRKNGLQFLEEITHLNVPKYMCSATLEDGVASGANDLGAKFFDKMEFKKILEALKRDL